MLELYESWNWDTEDYRYRVRGPHPSTPYNRTALRLLVRRRIGSRDWRIGCLRLSIKDYSEGW